MTWLLLFLLSVTLFDKSIGVTPSTPKTEVNYRLPTNILPTHYNLSFKPYLLESDAAKRFTFEAEVFINIEAYEPGLSAIILHSKNLSYTVRELYQTTTSPYRTYIPILNVKEDSVTDKFTLNLASPLKTKTNYTLHFVLTGAMGDNMAGFYKSFYVDERNNTRWLGATQFQTHFARRAFPCFDEPTFKATFDVAVERFRSFKTVSNSRMISTKRKDKNFYRDVFATTPKMSTYLLSFIVSDFNERCDVEGEFYITARPEYYSLTEYALSIGRKLLSAYNKYTELPFHEAGIDKMHLAAIPDFEAGAMENWGLLTYREQYLLYDVSSSSLRAKSNIAQIIAHEMAHMWFGDIVTCEWWSYTWLNEAFASYFQIFMTAKASPDLQLDRQFTVLQLQYILEKESRNDTHPLTDLSAISSDDLPRMFNEISYYKGASVVRMFQHALGEMNFHRALVEYLKAFKYSNTKPENMLDSLKAYWPAWYKKYADGMFSSFTEQVGYPVIKLSISNDSKSMTIEQKRFLLEPLDGSDGSLLYTVPFTYTTNLIKNFTSTQPSLYVPASTSKVIVYFNDPVKWVVGNIQQTGFYRVNYNTQGWEQLNLALNSENWGGIHELNRAQYVDDLLALSRSGELSFDVSLKYLNYLSTEISYAPWKSAFLNFEKLANRLGSDKSDFANYITKLTQKAYDSFGFVEKPTDTTLDIYLRNDLIQWNCEYGRDDCIAEALRLFRNMHTKPIPVNIRTAVYCTAMRDGNEGDFESLYQLMKSEPSPTELNIIITNLGCVRQKNLVDRFFMIILSDDIRRQDKKTALTALFSSDAENVSPVFEHMTERFEALHAAIGSNVTMAKTFYDISLLFTTREQHHKFENFIKEKGAKLGSAVKMLQDASGIVKKNLEWSEKRLVELHQFLKGFSNGGRKTCVSFLSIALMGFIIFFLN